MTLGGRTYVVPADALPYLGRGLDPGLFDIASLLRDQAGGRLPVEVRYAGRVPSLPGDNDWFNNAHGKSCGFDYLCVAKKGYDAPAGLGTPDGIGAF